MRNREPRTANGRTYGGDLGNTRYSPLDQINADNFNKSQIAWRFKTDHQGPAARVSARIHASDGAWRSLHHGRIAPRGAGAGRRHGRAALDCTARTKVRAAAQRPRQLSGRGLAYWTDGKEERILYVTPGYRLVALDAKTGVPDIQLRQERRGGSEAG